METEIKMLSDIHKNADMGQDTLRHILDATKDAEFSKTVSRQMQEYEKAFQVSGQMLKARNAPEEQKEAPMISKWMAHMNINRKSMQDMQTSKLAEMLIQGSTMGVTSLTRQIRDYDGEDTEVLDFAKKQLKREEKNIDELKDIHDLIEKAIVDDPPMTIKDGGIIKIGYDEEIDKLKTATTEGKNWIVNLEAEEREKTGIKNLKIGYNKVFGYFIEVTNSYLNMVPQSYVRKQTRKNDDISCNRYASSQ